jgi:hypothetical protein
MAAAIDGNYRGEISSVAAHKIGERADRVKRLRKLLRQRELAQNVLSDKELRDRFGCARPPFVTRKSPFCDAVRVPEKRDCRTLFEVRSDGTCEFELPIKNICFSKHAPDRRRRRADPRTAPAHAARRGRDTQFIVSHWLDHASADV